MSTYADHKERIFWNERKYKRFKIRKKRSDNKLKRYCSNIDNRLWGCNRDEKRKAILQLNDYIDVGTFCDCLCPGPEFCTKEDNACKTGGKVCISPYCPQRGSCKDVCRKRIKELECEVCLLNEKIRCLEVTCDPCCNPCSALFSPQNSRNSCCGTLNNIDFGPCNNVCNSSYDPCLSKSSEAADPCQPEHNFVATTCSPCNTNNSIFEENISTSVGRGFLPDDKQVNIPSKRGTHSGSRLLADKCKPCNKSSNKSVSHNDYEESHRSVQGKSDGKLRKNLSQNLYGSSNQVSNSYNDVGGPCYDPCSQELQSPLQENNSSKKCCQSRRDIQCKSAVDLSTNKSKQDMKLRKSKEAAICYLKEEIKNMDCLLGEQDTNCYAAIDNGAVFILKAAVDILEENRLREEKEVSRYIELCQLYQAQCHCISTLKCQLSEVTGERDSLKEKLCLFLSNDLQSNINAVKEEQTSLSDEVKKLESIAICMNDIQRERDSLFCRLKEMECCIQNKECELVKCKAEIEQQQNLLNSLVPMLNRDEVSSSSTEKKSICCRQSNYKIAATQYSCSDTCLSQMESAQCIIKLLQEKSYQQGCIIETQQKCLLEQKKYINEQESLKKSLTAKIKKMMKQQIQLILERNKLKKEILSYDKDKCNLILEPQLNHNFKNRPDDRKKRRNGRKSVTDVLIQETKKLGQWICGPSSQLRENTDLSPDKCSCSQLAEEYL